MDPAMAYLILTRAREIEQTGRWLDAELMMRQLVARLPDYIEARFAYAQTLLLHGRWTEAWPHFEARLGMSQYQANSVPMPMQVPCT